MVPEQVSRVKQYFCTNTKTSATSPFSPVDWKSNTFSFSPFSPCNLVGCLIWPTVLILACVSVTLLRSGHCTHHSPPTGSDLPPDLAQTVIRANQHTSQQCPWRDAGITATSDPQVFLQTISNLPLSQDKVYMWGGGFQDSMSSSEAPICWWASGPQLPHSWFCPQQVTQNLLIRLMLHSCQLTNNSACATAFLSWGFLWQRHCFELWPANMEGTFTKCVGVMWEKVEVNAITFFSFFFTVLLWCKSLNVQWLGWC